MLLFTASSTGARLTVDSAHIAIFPETPKSDEWSLLAHPTEELTDFHHISWPGEYDFSGISMRAIGQEGGKNVSYHFVTENIRVACIAAPLTSWTDGELSKLGEVDILLIGVDDTKKMMEVIEAIDPRVVILLPSVESDVASILKACGSPDATPFSEYKVKAGSLPQDSRQVVVLQAS